MKGIKTLTLGALCAAVAGISLAQAPREKGERRPEGAPEARMARGRGMGGELGQMEGRQMMLGRMIRDPELCKEAGISEEQATELRARTEALDTQLKDLRTELSAAGLRQAELLTDVNTSEADLMGSVDELGRIRTEMARLMIRGVLDVREILTPEQIERARTLMQERLRERMRNRRRDGGADQAGGDANAERQRVRQRPEGAHRERPRQDK